jgi:hypothetical protein
VNFRVRSYAVVHAVHSIACSTWEKIILSQLQHMMLWEWRCSSEAHILMQNQCSYG